MCLMSCKSSLKLTSKVKQTVFPGRPMGKVYTNYVLKFSLQSDEKIDFERIEILHKGKCYTTKEYFLKKEKSARFSKKITEKGIYVLEIPLKENKLIAEKDCADRKNEMTIYFQENDKPQKLHINEFTLENKTHR